MADFNRVRTGISGLKKERDELRKSYELLAAEVRRMAQANAADIKSLNDKASSLSSALAGMDERIGKAAGDIGKTGASLSSDITEIRKRLEAHKKTIIDLGERVRGVADSTAAAGKDIAEGKKADRDVAKTLQELTSTVSGITEKVAAIGASLEGRLSSAEDKLTPTALPNRRRQPPFP